MKKSFIILTVVLGILTFLFTTNFKFQSGNDKSGNISSVIPLDSNRWMRSHDVYNDVKPFLIIPPYKYYPPTKDNPLIFTNVDISNNTAPQNEPSVKISRKNPNRVVAAWRDFRIGVNPAVRRVGYSYSTNGGVTWSVSALIDSTLLGGGLLRNSDPSVATDTAGNFYITTIALDNTNNSNTLAIFKSTDGGVTFPIGQSLASGSVEDKEMVTCDNVPGSPYRNNIYISWSRLALAADINLIRSTNAGQTWSSPVAVSTSSTSGQGSDPAVGVNGEVYVVWIGGTFSTDIQYFSKSTNGGQTFSTPQVVGSGPVPTIPWSQSGGTTFPSIATDVSGGPMNGNIYVTWCDGRNGDCDVFLSRSTDHGTSWSSAVRVNNDGIGNGKVQAWPWIGVSDSGKIAIVFFDNRNTPSSTIIEAWVARSSDGGLTFTNDVLSSQQSPTNTPNSDVRFGDYIGIDYWAGKIVPVWTDERAGGFDMDIYTAVVTNVQLTHDIQVGPFLSLPSNFMVNNAYDIKTRIQNIGTMSETGVPIKFFINGVLTNTTNKNLNVGQVDSVTNSWTPAVSGTYQLMYVSALSTDENRANDTVRTTVVVNASIPALCEGFSGTTFPPTGWNVIFTGTDFWSRNAVSGFCAGQGSAQMDFYDFASGSQQLNTKSFSPTGTNDSLVFQDAYATYQSENDQLQILTSTNAGTTWTPLVTLNGGTSGELVTAPPTTSPFTPTCTQWKYQRFLLPPQTNMIQFNAITAFGNNLYVDSICLHLGIGIIPIGNNKPTVYSLSQNYPNPFNPTTKIQFALPKAGLVKLVVYNLLGEEVAALVNEYRQAGYHSVDFNGINLASGIYFYRITSGNFTDVKKMVLVK